jgi:hypothetical protein
MEPEGPIETETQDDGFATQNAAIIHIQNTSSAHISPAALSTLLNTREPSFLDTRIWHSKSSSQSQPPPARSKKAALMLPPVSSPPRPVIIPPPTAAAIMRYKLTLGDEDGMFDPVRRYNEVAKRMKASISKALARSMPSPRIFKPLSRPSPSSPGVGDSNHKLWTALPALPRLFGDMQRAAGGMGRTADIGASHWLNWCSDQEVLGRVPHLTRAVGLEALMAAGCNGSFKLSLQQFSQCLLMLALKVQYLESTPAPCPPSFELATLSVTTSSSTEETNPPPEPPVQTPNASPTSPLKAHARSCSSEHVSLCKTFLKRLATATPTSPPVHERSRRSCKSSSWFGKVPAIDKLYNELGGSPFSRAAFMSAVFAAFGEQAPCSEDLLGFAFDWAANICNSPNDDQATLDYDGLWQALLYACGHCNSSSAPPIRCSSSALRAVHSWSSNWKFSATLQSPPPRTALPNVSMPKPSHSSHGNAKLKPSSAALSNYASILGGIDPNHAAKTNADREESISFDTDMPVHSVSFAELPPPIASRMLSPTRVGNSRDDHSSALESRAGSRTVASHREASRPVTGIGGFSLPTVNERLRTSPIRLHGTTSLVNGIVKTPGPNPLVTQPHPVLDKTFAGRVQQAKFTFQPEFSSQRIFGHFVSRDVVLGPVPRYILNLPATADTSFVLQASPPRRYPQGKNINPQWAGKLNVNDELFDKSLKGHEVRCSQLSALLTSFPWFMSFFCRFYSISPMAAAAIIIVATVKKNCGRGAERLPPEPLQRT